MAQHPDEAAVDAGGTVLTYRRLAEEVDAVRRRLADSGHRGRRPRRRPGPVRHRRALRRDPRRARRGRRLRAGRRRRPGRAGRAGLRRGRGVRGARRRRVADHARRAARPAGHARARTTTRGSSSPPARPARPKGVAVSHRCRRGVRRRRGAAVPRRRADRARRPGAGRAVGGVRRLLRGDVAGLAARRLPGAGARGRWCAPASTSGRGWSRSGSPSSPPCRRSPRCGRPDALDDVRLLIFGGEACPPRAGRAAGRRGPRGVEHLRADRGHRRRLRRAADRRGAGADRAAARRLGARRRRRRGRAGRDGRDRRAGDRRRRARPLPRRRARTPRSSRRCRRWAGRAPTAAATSSAPSRGRAAVPRAGRRAGQARRAADRAGRGRRRAAGAARGRAARRPPCAAPRRATSCWSGTSCPTTSAELRHRRRGARLCASSCPPRSCRCSRWSTACRPGPRARSTGTRCRGRWPTAATGSIPSRRAC